MVEKTSQTSSASNMPNVPAVAPTSDTPYIQPVIGKLGYDTEHPDIFGIGSSPDNGVSFHVWASFKGLVLDKDDMEAIWIHGVSDRVKSEVNSATAEIPAVESAANEGVRKAENAIDSSKVNSDAIVAQSEAISEAKSAMDSATAEIQQTASNAASDAAKIRADVAQVQNEVDTAKAANSASVEALKSDIDTAKQDLANVHDSLTKAQSAVEQNQKLINDSVAKITSDVSATKQDLADVHDSLTKAQAAAEQNQKAIDKSIAQINDSVDATNQDLAGVRKDLTKAQSDIAANQKSINDNVAQINSNIEQDRKDIASAQQANADTAKQLDTYSKQATEQGKTIKTIQDKQDGFTATLADVQGNVSQVSDKVDGLSASLKDTQGNVASVKAQADQLSATLTNHGKSIATLTASAKELSSTLEDADGRLSKVEQTAQTNSSTLSDVQGDLSQVKQDATTLTSTLKDTQGNISTLQQKADSVSAQLASAQGDIATLQTGVDSVKATLTSHDKSIHTLQADSKSLKDSMTNAQGDISTLQKSATSLDSEMKDHAGRLSKVEQNAATQATTLSDLQGNLSQVKQQADGLVTTLKDAQGDITQIQQKADGTLAQLKSAQGDIASLQTDVTGIKATLVSHEGDIHTLQADSKSLHDSMQDVQGNISTLQKTSTDVTSELQDHAGRISKVEQTASTLTNEFSDQDGRLSKVEQTATGTQQMVANQQGQINSIQTDVSGIHETITGQGNQITNINVTLNGLNTKYEGVSGDLNNLKSQAQWATVSSAVDLNNVKTPCHEFLKGRVTNAPNEWAWWYLTVEGSDSGRITQTVIADQSNNRYTRRWADGWSAWVKDATQTDVTALSNRITTNSTQITQNKSAIALKADQTVVDAVKNTASQNSSRLDVMANEVKSKVTSTDVNNIVNGKGYATTSSVQSLIDQRAGTINESITKISKEFDTRNGVNMLTGTADFSGSNWFNKDTGWCTQEDWLPPEAKNKVYRDANHAWNGLGQAVNLDVGTYTFSMWIYTEFTGSQSMTIYAGDNQYGGTAQLNVTQGFSYSANQQQNAWIKARFYFTVTKAGIVVVRPELNQSSGIFHVASYKLEKGTNPNPVWSPAPGDNATTTQIQSLTASIDGIQSAVRNKADSSTVTQLSNLVQSKVSSDSFNSSITQLNNAISARVSKGNLLSEINLQADGTLIKGKKIFLDGQSVVFADKAKAFIPDAAITNVTADKITAGTIKGVNLLINNANDVTTITNAGVTNAGLAPNMTNRYITTQVNNGVITFSSAQTGKNDQETLNNITNSANSYTSAIFGNNGDLLESSKGTITIHAGDLVNDKSFWTSDGVQISSSIPEAEIKLKPVVNEQPGGINLTASTSIIDMTEGKLSIFTTVGDTSRGQGVQINGLGMGGSTIWSPANYFAIGSQQTQSYTPVNAQSFNSQSVLSSKTRIKRLDRQEALSVIMRDDIYTYLYKSDVRLGWTKRHASLVIDDENDVKQYRAPEEFITNSGDARDDGTQLGYLIAAVQYQQEEIEELKKKLEEK